MFSENLFTDHHFDYFFIGFFHAFFSETANVGNGRFYAFGNNPVTGIELLGDGECEEGQIWEAAIFAAQDAFAPSQIIPETMASALTTV